MPFKPHIFQQNIAGRVPDTVEETLAQACETYKTLTSPQQKAGCIREMMDALDQAVDAPTRKAIMEACGRKCIGDSRIKKTRQVTKSSPDIDTLLDRLNQEGLGGGHLRREGDGIHASYDRCYCGSVNKTSIPFSATYCRCSCGWYRQLFETLLGKPVEVELLGSIIQGDDKCRFLIYLPVNRESS